MDTINNPNSPPTNNQQPVQQQNPAVAVEQETTQYQSPDIAKGKNNIITLILVILLIAAIAIIAYLVFKNSIGYNAQVIPVTSSSLPSPSPTSIPITPTPTDEFYVEDPEIDIKAIDDSTLGL